MRYLAKIRLASVITVGLVAVLLLAPGTFAGSRESGALSPRVLCNRLSVEAAGTKLPEIWTMDYSGGSFSRLQAQSTPPYNVKNAVYAPNGSWIAFSAVDQDPTYKSSAINLARYDGTDPVQVTPFMDLSQFGLWPSGEPKRSWEFEVPTFSRDSSKIYFTATLVQRNSEGNIIYNDPNTGDPIAYVSDMYVVGVDGTNCGPVRPSFETAFEMLPQCSPVDDRIALVQNMGGLTDFQTSYDEYGLLYGVAQNEGIFTINPDGSGYTKIVPSVSLFDPSFMYSIQDRITPMACAWSPDGSKLAVAYWVMYPDRWTSTTQNYMAISVVDSGQTTNINKDWTNNIQPANYSYGTRVTPVGFPTPGSPTIFDAELITRMSWTPDGTKLLFDATHTPPAIMTQQSGNIYYVDVSDLSNPGAPVQVSTDNISCYPCASPDNLGDDPIDPPLADQPFYLAEGTTRPNFDEWLAIQNPNQQDANVNLDYQLAGGAGPGGANKSQQIVVPKQSRYTVKVVDTVGQGEDVSVVATSDQPVIVERPMYFNYGADKGLGWTGGHDVVGSTAARETWYFAEGTTRNNSSDGAYEEWLCLQNPNDDDAEVTIDYMLGTGENKEQKVTVKGKSRYTVNVNEAVGPDQDVSCKVTANRGIIAERPIYFNYKNKWAGGHNVIGAAAPGKTWYFAEGTTRNNASDGAYDEWLCLQNPNDDNAEVTITYMLGTGENKEQTVTVEGKSRYTVSVNEAVGPDQDVSCKITADKDIVAERPIYFNYRNIWPGGHDVIGAALAKSTWYFAEGTTNAGFDEWLCLQNPNDDNAEVTINYMLGNGENKEQKVTVNGKSRYTVDVRLFIGDNQDVSAKVTSSQPIIAERPMYFSYGMESGLNWTGGHNVLGY